MGVMIAETAVRERPILFSGPMVRAILDGRKTQTRRIITPQAEYGATRCHYSRTGWAVASGRDGCACKPIKGPPGDVGDRLWVREAWRCNHIGGHRIEYKAGGACLECHDWPKDAIPPYAMPTSAAQVKRAERQLDGEKIPDAWRPSIHMPRWAGRITLEVTGVKVERIQDITEEDAKAEGVEWKNFVNPVVTFLPTSIFQKTWDEINGNREGCDWASNPWVWAIEFRRVEA